MSEEFKYLFTPFKIGSITVRNRIYTPPYATLLIPRSVNIAEDEGRGWWDRFAYYHAERARGGVGLTISSDMTAHPSGALPVIDERHIPHLRQVTDMVHAEGGKIIQMIHHVGRHGRTISTRQASYAPSPIRGPLSTEIPHEMDVDEIKDMVQRYARTAYVLKESGYDGVELQGAHGFLLCSFLSPHSNKRADEYGGSIENRMRFMVEISEAIRETCGRDFVLGTSISMDELTPGGLTLDDSKEIVKRLEEGGLIDFIESRIGNYGAVPVWIGDMSVPLGMAVPLSAAIKEITSLPVFTVLRIKDPVQAEKILADGHADMVGFGRASICDPELPNKAKEGRLDDIRNCIACNQGCVTRIRLNLPVNCIQNPAVGEEREYGEQTFEPAEVKKKLIVVGGGPGGMKAAEIAARRGHTVTLYEKESELGGQINIIAKDPKREEFRDVTRHLETQIKKLGVEIALSTEATVDLVLKEEPDAVIIATGSEPALPDIPGVDQDNVLTVHQLLLGEAEVGQNVLVIDCGEYSWKFAGAAEFLVDKGKSVHMITPAFFAGMDLPGSSVLLVYQRLLTNNVKITPLSEVKSIDGDQVTIANLFTKKEQVIEGVDTVIFAVEGKACYDLYKGLKGKVRELYSVGDCVAPRRVDAAIREGFLAGRSLWRPTR